jgi:site-specific DNA-methyltransferase (adenine-specific)
MTNKSQRRNSTKTSSFGSPGRVSHDATPFYNSKLYESQPQDRDAPYQEVALSQDCLDTVYQASSEHMEMLPDNCIHLMVTSPPYNVGKEYDDDLTLGDYLAFLRRVWVEVHRTLVPGGRACINIANLGRKPYIPLHAFIVQDMIELGFLMRGEIIWNKAASASSSTAWGSWQSASNPTLRDVHEYILVFSKDTYRRAKIEDRTNTISKEDFLEFTKSVWTFPAEPAKKVGHPAPFPIELPYRLIQLYTYEGEVVLDPFMGSGQTALAAKKAGRHYIGYEIDPGYVELANARIGQFDDEEVN